jgi:hypothetical protein
MNLREKLDQVRISFDTQLAEVLLGRLDLTHAQVKKAFGISEKVIRRVTKQFNVGARKRGPKRRNLLNAERPQFLTSSWEPGSTKSARVEK